MSTDRPELDGEASLVIQHLMNRGCTDEFIGRIRTRLLRSGDPGVAVAPPESVRNMQRSSDTSRLAALADQHRRQAHGLEFGAEKLLTGEHKERATFEARLHRAFASELDELHAAVRAVALWQPIDTCPRDQEVFFWLVPKTADEAYTDTSGKPITVDHAPYWRRGKWLSWGALSKPTHWMPLPQPPESPSVSPTISAVLPVEASDQAIAQAVRATPQGQVVAVARPAPRALDHLEELAADPRLRVEGWDSYESAPLDDRAVDAARKFLRYEWAVVPTPNGGIQLERHHSDCDIEVEFAADGSLEDISADKVAALRAVAPPQEPT